MAISDKLTYLNETKSQLKDMINYGLDENKITSSTTFRNYVTSIFNAFLEALRTPDTLFNNLPKKSGSGTQITLNGTANAPMRIELGATELTQDGTPTPSSPQDIHTISGSNTIKVEGVQLFNKDTVLRDKTFTSADVISDSTGLFVSDYIKVTPSTAYYVNEYASVVIGLDKDKTSLGYIRNTSSAGTFTTGATCEYIRIRSHSTTIPMETAIANAMLNLGTTARPYQPYILQEQDVDLEDIEYCKIGNYSDEFIRDTDGTWQLKKNIGKVVLDGTQTCGYSNAFTAIYYSNSSIANVGLNDVAVMSNMAKGISINDLQSQNGIAQNTTANRILIKFDGVSSYNTEALISQYFASNNYDVYYTLATPTYTQITGTLANQLEYIYNQMLKSYKGQTNISQVNDDLSFNLSVQAIEEL